MAKLQKSFRVAVDQNLALEILNVAPQKDEADVPKPLGQRLKGAVEHLAEIIEEANEYLEGSELAQKLAEALALEKNKRGFPFVSVDTAGQVMLEVSYDAKRGKKKKRNYRSGLPLLEDLRKKATSLGVDVGHLGQKRRAIYDYLTEIESRKQGNDEPPKTEDAEPAQMAAGHDEVTVSLPKDGPKPPRKAKKVQLVTPGVTEPEPDPEPDTAAAKASPSLERLLEQAGDEDLSEILSDENAS